MQFRTLGQIYVDAFHAREWFNAVGITTTGSRLDQILNYIDGLLNPSVASAEPLGANATPADMYYALNDGAGFGLIATEMSKLPSHLLPRRTLQDILKGPLAASAEEGSSGDARNKFVELELAANLSSAGLKLLGFDDVKFEFEGYSYLVECKRPSQSNRLEYNIEKGYTQLKAKLNSSSDRGIVAVAVERVFDMESRIHPVGLATSHRDFARSIGEEFRSRISKYEGKWVDPRVVGVLAIMRLLMTTGVPDTIGSSYTLGLIKFTSGQPIEDNRLDRLIGKLRSNFLQG